MECMMQMVFYKPIKLMLYLHKIPVCYLCILCIISLLPLLYHTYLNAAKVSLLRNSEDNNLHIYENVTYLIDRNEKQLSNFIASINTIRNYYYINENVPRWDIFSTAPNITDAFNPEYFSILNKYRGICTLFLHLDSHKLQSLLLPDYFSFSSNDCANMEKKSVLGSKYAEVYFNTACKENISDLFSAKGLYRNAFNIGLPNDFAQNKKVVLTFMTVIQNAIVDEYGDIWTKDLRIIPQRCNKEEINVPYIDKIFPKTPEVDEVLTIAQYWGNGFFHSMVENLPRISPYLSLLRAHTSIKIHHHPTAYKFLELLDIPNLKERSITSKYVRGKIVFSPAGIPCGQSPVYSTQLLSFYLRKAASSNKSFSSRRNVIVLIKRSRRRYFANHKDILDMLQHEAAKFRYEVIVFADNPLPSLQKTMEIFYRAVMVVAPHGAGEANLLFSRPGTIIIEGLCWDVLGRVNLCYRDLSHILGLRHYLFFYNTQCMSITALQVQNPVNSFLKILAKEKKDENE